MRKLAWPVLLLFFSAAALLAQNYRGRIEGLVTDQTGAVIVSATVTLTDVGTGIIQVRPTSGTGMYLFDLLDPGTYTVKVELKGFREFIQENIILQASNDVTVNAVLQPGAVTQTIEVTATPSQVQFTTSNQDITLNSTLASETPRYDRNPFKLTLLAPEAINTRGEILPFLSWSANSVDLGGGTNLKNELEVDGSPVGMGHKYSYPPNMDAVEAVNVAQNSTDAEFGHSAGGVITTTTKSGTNQWHGSVYYLGRYPWANAIYDRTTMSTSSTRQNMIGGTIGGPIKKNKLFNFGSFEYWKVGNPTSFVYTVPTTLETTGDFSQSFNIDGSLKAVYDPYSTVFNSSTGAYTRTQFSCQGKLNVICADRMDPVAVMTMGMMWPPNNPGDNITGVNNSKLYSIDAWNYYNFSDRVDYNVTDKWKMFARYSGYHTTDIYSNWTPNKSQLYVPTGTVRTSKQLAGDAVWTVNTNTVVDVHASYQRLVDAYDSTPMAAPGWASLWPKNPWYVPLLQASSNVPVYFPDFVIGGEGFGGRGFYWDQRPLGEDFSAKYSHQFGSGFLKAGLQMHHAYGPVYVSNTSQFYFDTANTANTPVNPNLLYSGDQWGSFLLGSLGNDTEVIAGPAPSPHTTLYSFWVQYDWRVTRKVTLNLGLRDEYEKAWSDPNRTLSRGLDLTAPVPEMVATPPVMPAQAINLVGSNYWKWNGEWQWTDNEHPGMWNPPKLAVVPRVGVAIKLTEKTALRAGYARFVIPTEFNFTSAPVSGFEDVNFLEPPFFGMTQYQFAAPFVNGVPEETISNPFPSSNPLLPIEGKSAGGDVGRGGTNLLWYPANLKKAFNDRFNINFQRQLPAHVMASATYFLNLGHQHYTKELNGLDPRLEEQYQNALTVSVPNPFYQYLNTVVMPGPYYYQPTLPLSSFLVPYPQYGPLFTLGNCCALEHYNQLQVQVQRPFTRGLNFLFGYVYTRESYQINNFNDSTYFLNQFQWQDADQPRHRWNLAGTYELPFGRAHRLGSTLPAWADYVIGGWRLTPVLQYVSGDFPRFGNDIVTGNPCISNPTPTHWFNTSVFQPQPANTYVLRTNPFQYTCLTGPSYWDLDASLAKEFKIWERFTGQLKMTAYNATNRLNRGDPDTGVTSSTFGEALYQGTPGGTFGFQSANENTFGRQIEFGFKIFF